MSATDGEWLREHDAKVAAQALEDAADVLEGSFRADMARATPEGSWLRGVSEGRASAIETLRDRAKQISDTA